MDKSRFNNINEWRKFGIALTVMFFILGTMLYMKNRPFYFYFYGAGVAAIFSTAKWPVFIKPFYIFFSYIGYGMSWVMTRIILAVFYYLVLTPIGLLGRIFGKKFLDLKFHSKKLSYWIDTEESDPEKKEKNYEDQY
ncbi:MAG: hypothetical protein ACM3SY_19770 [Candidatus Omnitrophota bacterium]